MDATRGDSGSAWLAGLTSLAPGPGLAAVLASVDRSVVGADAMLDVVAARARLLWHVQGELLADLAQVVAATRAAEPAGSNHDGDSDGGRVVEAVGEVVGWTLHWTARFAQGQVAAAEALGRRLPMVLAAVREGRIDQAKAEAFVDVLACVSDETAARIATRLLPKAGRWTLTELRASLRYHVDRADPKAARRRYRRRVAERDVWLQAQPDGTASLSAQGLAPHRAAAAFDRIDRLARAARAGGDVRTLAQLRADAFCDVLAGVPFQLVPGHDPLTAQADASAEGRPDRAWSLPGWRVESRFPNGTPGGGRPDEHHGCGAAAGGHRDGQHQPDGGGGVGDEQDRQRQPGGCGAGLGVGPARGDHAAADGVPGESSCPEGGWGSGLVPPEPPDLEPTGVIDLYDYDRACVTDQDRAWINIGYEPPGAADDETPDWWHACRPAPPRPDHPHAQESAVPASTTSVVRPASVREPVRASAKRPIAARSSAAGPESRLPNRNPGPDPDHPVPVRASARSMSVTGRESCLPNRIPGPDPDHPVPGRAAARSMSMAGRESRLQNGISGVDPEDLVWAVAQADALYDRAVLSRDVLPADRCGGCGGRLVVRPGVVDVQVKLTTLAGLDEDPALIPGLGVTLAPIARLIAFDPHTRPTWRWSIFDPDGDLLHHGLTRHRPTAPEPRLPTRTESGFPTGKPEHPADRWEPGPAPGSAVRVCGCARVEPGRRRGTVELQLTLATLHELLTHPHRAPGWQTVLADIAAQVERDRRLNPPGKWQQTDQHGNLYHHGHTQRMPDAVEEAFIRARDRSCRAPHCPVTASRCELDHRIEYAKGGPSHRGCVDLRCKRHHHMRDRHDIRITRTGPTVTWTIPSGRTFTVTTDKDLILTRET